MLSIHRGFFCPHTGTARLSNFAIYYYRYEIFILAQTRRRSVRAACHSPGTFAPGTGGVEIPVLTSPHYSACLQQKQCKFSGFAQGKSSPARRGGGDFGGPGGWEGTVTYMSVFIECMFFYWLRKENFLGWICQIHRKTCQIHKVQILPVFYAIVNTTRNKHHVDDIITVEEELQ